VIRRATLALLGATAIAAAQPDPGQAAYEEGRRLYDLQEWDAAIAKFKEAYRLRDKDAASLFNIAQSYRLKGDCGQALAFYRTYKRNFPDEKNLAKVDKFISEMEACAPPEPPKPEPPKPEPPKPEPPRPVPVQPTPPPLHETPAPPSNHRGLAIGLLAGGGLSAIAGTVFALAAHDQQNTAETGHGTWDPGIQSSGNRDALLGKVFLGAGGAALVAGAVMFVLGGSSTDAPQVTLVPRAGGGIVGWSHAF
jgi:tetratricopeptide (TPR) repeat protein